MKGQPKRFINSLQSPTMFKVWPNIATKPEKQKKDAQRENWTLNLNIELDSFEMLETSRWAYF